MAHRRVVAEPGLQFLADLDLPGLRQPDPLGARVGGHEVGEGLLEQRELVARDRQVLAHRADAAVDGGDAAAEVVQHAEDVGKVGSLEVLKR